MKTILALEDGTIFEGQHFGAPGECIGEVVFNTSMTGYQEVLTDPSYKGQIVTMTYPLIGNYGCNVEDFESSGPKVEGFIVREYSSYHSNWRGNFSLGDFLEKHGILGIQGVDTRALTKRLRIHGVMNGIISTEDLDTASLVAKAQAFPGLEGTDLVKDVTCQTPYLWGTDALTMREDEHQEKQVDLQLPTLNHKRRELHPKFNVVAMDFGAKMNILRRLSLYGCKITVVPAHTSAEEILSLNPDGIFLSNGPGDPIDVPYAVETVRRLIGTKPIFGICLGHQILGLAFGGVTYKLKFGHRGANQPVKHLATGRVEITAQNHGYCVDIDSLTGKNITITHINLNDDTLEGIQHEELPIFSVQYHPEASPGPHDADYLFARFIELMQAEREK
ncbi:TPA: glutamine-hydrolyzing carbamoyl-phosphate synthase small subunit [Candidatus Poribacteria bacterium]|nr:glutamine-hydrolyzing carbamoyl-phosphate synthase small subunit [Candidatus Poribacteria bacterium]